MDQQICLAGRRISGTLTFRIGKIAGEKAFVKNPADRAKVKPSEGIPPDGNRRSFAKQSFTLEFLVPGPDRFYPDVSGYRGCGPRLLSM